MMKTFKYLILIALSALMLASCSHELDYLEARGEGLLRFNFDYDLEAEMITKAEESDLVFEVYVLKLKEGEEPVIVKHWPDHRIMTSTTLRAGRYEIRAVCGQDKEAAFDSPYYYGSTIIDVVVGEEVNATVLCQLANVKATVAVSENVETNYSDYSIQISNEAPNGELDYTSTDGIGREGYFRCTGTLKWTITLTNTDGTKFDPIFGYIDDVKPRHHYHLTFDVNGEGDPDQGGVSLRVTLDGTLVDHEHDVNISLNKDPMPTITGRNISDLTQTIFAPQGVGNVGLFTITSVAGVERVTLSHSSSAIEKLGVPRLVNILEVQSQHYKEQGLVWTDGATVGSVAIDIDMREMLASKLDLGTYEFQINVLDVQAQYISIPLTIKVIPNTEVSTQNVNAWAKFAYVYGQYNTETEPVGMGFQYKKASDASWIDFTGELTKEGTYYSAKITGLTPSTEYQFRAITAAEQKDENIVAVTTEAADQLPNFSFDNWYKDGKNWYAAADNASIFWDSGNQGANTLSEKNPTSPEESKVISGKAVRMRTESVVGVMAGGNIYSGSFGKTIGAKGAQVNFGRPYTCRPLALHGHYAYTPKAIDKVKSPWESLKGQMDIGKIFVVLADWNAPFLVDNSTSPRQLFSPDDPGVIAYGELEDNVGTPNGDYVEFTIPLEYRDYNRKPTYVIVVACASKYADYFTGAIGSEMYIDEFEFIFE